MAVTLKPNDTGSGVAKTYYTTGASPAAPDTSSTVYSGPITVGAPVTLQAVAIAPNSSVSASASAAGSIGK